MKSRLMHDHTCGGAAAPKLSKWFLFPQFVLVNTLFDVLEQASVSVRTCKRLDIAVTSKYRAKLLCKKTMCPGDAEMDRPAASARARPMPSGQEPTPSGEDSYPSSWPPRGIQLDVRVHACLL